MEYQVSVRAAGMPIPEDQMAPNWAKRMFELDLSIKEIWVSELDTGMELTVLVEAASAACALRIAENVVTTYYEENPSVERMVRQQLVRREWRVEPISSVAV